MISASRKNDAVISICQRNDEQHIEILDANPAAQALLGYSLAELSNKPLEIILPTSIKDDVRSDVEYQPGGNDIATLFRKIRHFCILNKQGKEIPVNLKVFYVPATDRNPRFELLMRDISLLEKMEELRRQFNTNRHAQEIMDPVNHLPKSDSTLQDVELIKRFAAEHSVDATFATMGIDNINQIMSSWGENAVQQVIATIGKRFQQSFREEDIIGNLPRNLLGVILFDCNENNAPAVLNRVRQVVSTEPIKLDNGTVIPITISVGYVIVDPKLTVQNIVNLSQAGMERAKGAGGNTIVAG